jgi:oligopeptide transport system ATP-binding protein
MSKTDALVRCEAVTKHFPVPRGSLLRREVGAVSAVDDVSLDVLRGETLGLVGESGSGKSTLGRTILLLYAPTWGRIVFDGEEITALDDSALRGKRRRFQMVFQDPHASLNPRLDVFGLVSEPLIAHRIGSARARREKVAELLDLVQLGAQFADRFPHEMSGGQRQRVGIARALALEPEFLVLDEPIAALDVSIQAQVVNLLEELQEKLRLTYLFIAHDLSMVRHISDRVAVMYLGKIVELARQDELYEGALHPYTRALISAIPIADPVRERKRRPIVLEGDIPSPTNPPSGCRFHTRCPIAKGICRQVVPEWRELKPGHWVACHFPGDGDRD